MECNKKFFGIYYISYIYIESKVDINRKSIERFNKIIKKNNKNSKNLFLFLIL